jgi:hypothetical protein
MPARVAFYLRDPNGPPSPLPRLIHDLERNQHFCNGPLERIVLPGLGIQKAPLRNKT